MLKQLRTKKATKRIMFWTLVLVIPSFVFFYGYSSSQRGQQERASSLAWVKDKWYGLRKRPIAPFEQELAQYNLTSRYWYYLRSIGLQNVTYQQAADFVEPLDVAREAVDEYYLRRYAERKGLFVPDEEIKPELSQSFAGLTRDQVERIIEQQGMTVDGFLARMKDGYLLQKARNLLAARAKASLFELWQEYLIGEEKIQVQYVKVPSIEFEDKVEVTTASLQAYYKDHPDTYRVGDQVAFRYVAVFRSDILDATNPTTDVVRQYYEDNQKAFRRERSVSVRHIFRSAGPDDPTTHTEAQKARIEQIAAELAAGADFAALANKHTQDTSNIDRLTTGGGKGGLIATPITRDSPSIFGDKFKRVALLLDEGQVSSPVLGALGWHLIKADSVTTAGVPPFEEIEERVRRVCREDMADKEFKRRGDQLKELFRQSAFSTLDAYARAANLETTTTALIEIGRNPFIPRIGSISDQLELIKELTGGELFEGVMSNASAHFVLELNRKVPSHVPPLEEILEDVREDYVTSMSTTLAHRAALELWRKARDLGKPEDVPSSPALVAERRLENLKRLAGESGFKVEPSEPFTRLDTRDFMPDLDRKFARNTLRFKTGDIYMTTQGGADLPLAYVVWFFEKREEPSLVDFRRDLPQIRAEYLSRVQQAMIEERLHDMRSRGKAGINPDFLPKPEAEAEGKDSG